MAGSRCFDRDVETYEETVDRWLSTYALQELAKEDFAQIDIDELFDTPPQDAVRVGLDCLHLALEKARVAHPEVDGFLTIPLPASESLVTEAPELATHVEKRWTYGPGIEVVGLYLVHSRVWRAFEAGEDYRRHLPDRDLLPSGYAAYYRSWRTDGEAVAGWDYNRAIYVRTT